MTLRALALTLLFVPLGHSTAHAQAPAESPEAVVERYRGHLVAADWNGAAALVHPADLADIRSTFDEVAALDGGPELIAEIGGGALDLSTSSDAEFFGAYLGWLMTGEPGALEMMAEMEWRIDDTLINGERALVMAEASFEVQGERMTMPDTTPLRLFDGEWRIDVTQLVTGLRMEFGLGDA